MTAKLQGKELIPKFNYGEWDEKFKAFRSYLTKQSLKIEDREHKRGDNDEFDRITDFLRSGVEKCVDAYDGMIELNDDYCDIVLRWDSVIVERVKLGNETWELRKDRDELIHRNNKLRQELTEIIQHSIEIQAKLIRYKRIAEDRGRQIDLLIQQKGIEL